MEKVKQERESEPDSIEPHAPGHLMSQDTMYVSYLKGVGRIYQQTVLDTYSAVAFVKVHTSQKPITAADTLNERALPFSAEQEIPLLRMLTDRGPEFYGRLDRLPYELYLGL